jgi:hypothetical protein
MTPLSYGFKYSLQDPRMTFPSLSVQIKTSKRTRPFVISILKFLFSQPHNFCFPGVAGLEVAFSNSKREMHSVGIRSSDRPARSQPLYRLSYPAHTSSCSVSVILVTFQFLGSSSKRTHIWNFIKIPSVRADLFYKRDEVNSRCSQFCEIA